MRVVEPVSGVLPKAKIPTVLLPAAEPSREATVDAVALATTQPEYVYFWRVVVAIFPFVPLPPKANIANVPSADGVTLLLNALIGEGP